MLALLGVYWQDLRNSNCQYTLGLETHDKWNLFDEPMYKVLIAIMFIIKSYIWVQTRGQTKWCLWLCATEGQCSYRKDSRSTTLSNCN